jgi:glycosyltransferase involved in cell wall biosynthesis
MARDCMVFHPGTQHSWQTALALQQLGRLHSFSTSIFYQPDRWPYRIEHYLPPALQARVHHEFRRFQHPALDPQLIRTAGVSEWLERIARRAGLRGLAETIDRRGNAAFSERMTRQIERERPAVLWGYDNASLTAFRAARDAGVKRVLDRTIGDWRAYNATMDAVYEDYADFFLSPDYRVAPRRIEINQAEYELADVILTGSPFAADTVRDHGGAAVADKVRVLNYCFDEALFAEPPRRRERANDEPLHFLFLGQAGVRKGIHLVLKTFARIPPSAARLTIVGDLQVPPAVFARYADRVDYRPTVARADVPALMAEADVFLFPTYFEGAGIVLYEALAMGMGLIQSRHAALAATPDTGLMLERNDEASLYEAVMTAIEDRARVAAWSAAGPAAAARYSFAHYRDGVGAVVEALRPQAAG